MKALQAVMVAVFAIFAATLAQAEIDGHGPDAWRVTGVSGNDRLNARMGPGTNYPVIETFAHDERGMQQVTCVPFLTPAAYERMTQAQLDALPARWCLMRDATLSKAGWVAQRFIRPDQGGMTPDRVTPPSATGPGKTSGRKTGSPASGTATIGQAQILVRDLYDAQARADRGQGPDPLQGRSASQYFTSEIVARLQSGGFGAHPLYGAQDFNGRIIRVEPDPDAPMLRGMITIHADFTNFGEVQRATFYLRADPSGQGAPLRIFRVEHDGWSYP